MTHMLLLLPVVGLHTIILMITVFLLAMFVGIFLRHVSPCKVYMEMLVVWAMRFY